VKVATRFLISFGIFIAINSLVGYSPFLRNPFIVLLLSACCGLLAGSAIRIFAILYVLGHLFVLLPEIAVIAALLFALMFFMYFSYTPKNRYDAVLTALLCGFRIPQVVPVALGLLKKPYAFLSMFWGVVIYYFLREVQNNEIFLSDPTLEESGIEKASIVIKNLVQNHEMYFVLATFFLTMAVVYFIHILSFRHAWKVAIIVGNLLELIIMLVGYFLLRGTVIYPWIFLGTILSITVSLLIELFAHTLSYDKVVQVQFEDDEYFYFVKAIPKVLLFTEEKSIKTIRSSKDVLEKNENEEGEWKQ
jgi:hypothetical protein